MEVAATSRATPRPRRTPLRPVTPLGQDLPEDTPSKVRLRGAVDSAGIRRRQEAEIREADLQVGLDLHVKLTEDRERKAEQIKADVALRRQLFTRQKEHKIATRQIEAEQEEASKARDNEQRKTMLTCKEEKKRELEAEKRMERKMMAETVAHEKRIKAVQEAREREVLAKEYAGKLAESRKKAEKEKLTRKEEMASRKAAILEAREKRARDRALAAATFRAEVEQRNEEAKAVEKDRRKAANEVRQSLRARAGHYREDKELLKSSAFAR
ncbi:unnamed protein product [Ascophyllum nodosum]